MNLSTGARELGEAIFDQIIRQESPDRRQVVRLLRDRTLGARCDLLLEQCESISDRPDVLRQLEQENDVSPDDLIESVGVDARARVAASIEEALVLLGEVEALRTSLHRLMNDIGQLLADVVARERRILVREKGHESSSLSEGAPTPSDDTVEGRQAGRGSTPSPRPATELRDIQDQP